MRYLIVLVAFLIGCGTVAGIKDDPVYSGESTVFYAPYDDVLKAARFAMLEQGLKIEQAYKVGGNGQAIIGKTDVSFWSYGEIVRVITIPDNEGVRVWVHQKRRGKLNVTAKTNYAESIFSSIELSLEVGGS